MEVAGRWRQSTSTLESQDDGAEDSAATCASTPRSSKITVSDSSSRQMNLWSAPKAAETWGSAHRRKGKSDDVISLLGSMDAGVAGLGVKDPRHSLVRCLRIATVRPETIARPKEAANANASLCHLQVMPPGIGQELPVVLR